MSAFGNCDLLLQFFPSCGKKVVGMGARDGKRADRSAVRPAQGQRSDEQQRFEARVVYNFITCHRPCLVPMVFGMVPSLQPLHFYSCITCNSASHTCNLGTCTSRKYHPVMHMHVMKDTGQLHGRTMEIVLIKGILLSINQSRKLDFGL